MAQRLATCRRKTDDDEFYTLYKDARKGLSPFDLRGKRIICPCDTEESNIYKYLKDEGLDVEHDCREWRDVDYSRYDIVITNPPFSQAREMIRHLISIGKDFILLVSDVLRYTNKKKDIFGAKLYYGKDAQRFLRPDGSVRAVHCGWISTIPPRAEESFGLWLEDMEENG